MSLKSTKEQLIKLLADEDSKVLALSGKWGTGKTFMWEEVRQASEKDKIKSALSVSLFGLSTIDQVKIKLIQSAAPTINSATQEGLKQVVRTLVKTLEGFHKSFAALGDAALLIAPTILKGKLIVLDDIERKHEKLHIGEILGFIDEFTQRYGCRFVLIFNIDQLDNRDIWDRLREKVVDQELRLNTTSAESFGVAAKLTPSVYSSQISKAVEICELTNIRIVRKVIKTVNQILAGHNDLTEAVLSRVIPSVVLLSAIHFKGIEDGPDFNFVLEQGTARDWDVILTEKKDRETPEDERKSRWKSLMNSLGIRGCDEFELLVVEFLESGLIDSSEIVKIIERYANEADVMNVGADCGQFFNDYYWDHRKTDQDLLKHATTVVEKSDLLNVYDITTLHEIIADLPDGKAVADEAIQQWLAANVVNNAQHGEFENLFNRKVHPLILEKFKEIEAKTQANTSALEAILYMAKNRGWNTRQVFAMRSATVKDMEAAIRTCPIEDLRIFMCRMLEDCRHRKNNEEVFGDAFEHFITASKRIVNDSNSVRLGKIVKRLFVEYKLEDLLESDLQ